MIASGKALHKHVKSISILYIETVTPNSGVWAAECQTEQFSFPPESQSHPARHSSTLYRNAET